MPSGAMMRIKWLRKALRGLDDEIEYLTFEDPSAARELYREVRAQTDMLARFPALGRPGRVYGTRELVLSRFPYVIPYSVKNGYVVILRVFHTSRRLPGDWQQ